MEIIFALAFAGAVTTTVAAAMAAWRWLAWRFASELGLRIARSICGEPGDWRLEYREIKNGNLGLKIKNIDDRMFVLECYRNGERAYINLADRSIIRGAWELVYDARQRDTANAMNEDLRRRVRSADRALEGRF